MTKRAATPSRPEMDDTPANKPYGISPYWGEGRKQRGWKLDIRRRGVMFHRSFNARDYGGLDGALQAALALRDEIDREHPLMSKREWCATLRSTNTSGVPGVPGVSRVSDRTGEHWKAHVYLSDGRQKTRQFSIAKYGEDRAYQLAVEARHKLLALVEGTAPACAPARHDNPPVVDFDEVLRQPTRLDPQPNPYASPIACEVVGVHLTHVKDKRPRPDGSHQVTSYWTAVIEREDGTPLRRYFSVPRHGDEEARRRAIAQRQAWEAQRARGEPYTARSGAAAGASGVIGVYRHDTGWRACITLPDGRIKTRYFAIHKYGDEGARQRAIEARAQLAQTYGIDRDKTGG
ncbi:MAG: AP2 domain-containing protein [Rhodocyclales bacterium]|nr:AP2 domain-containing protein [Rhodocyclales bacterium]